MKKFFSEFKIITESKWKSEKLNPNIYGLQIQPGTIWLEGHSNTEVDQIKQLLGVNETFFSKDLEELLMFTKGLSKPQINLNTLDINPKFAQSWKLNIDYLNTEWNGQYQDLKEHEEDKYLADLVGEDHVIVPIFANRYIVITNHDSKVYSVHGDDIVIYAETVADYLVIEFLPYYEND